MRHNNFLKSDFMTLKQRISKIKPCFNLMKESLAKMMQRKLLLKSCFDLLK